MAYNELVCVSSCSEELGNFIWPKYESKCGFLVEKNGESGY